MTKELIDKAKVVLADSFVFYMKAHNYHWNIVGPDFPQLHDFFGKIYDEVHDAVDDLAEHIRQLDAFVPGTLSKLKELSTIVEDDKIPTPQVMVSNLYDDNEKLLNTIAEVYELAERERMYGYSNFLQDRISTHSKYRWMFKSISLRK